ncbi:lytic murein transglycosylase [Alloalcanivorax mobilis]|uniref:lytic murein transglycosylase n=1 Tax=Alloalcanivorax mobilis TaxID=2019569 RepID=UPI000C790396|nr:lytic murein transglycosylase [Alloalcanivorax mobilis]
MVSRKVAIHGLAALLLGAASPALALTPEAFAQCLNGLGQQAREQGLDPRVVERALGQAKLDEKVMELDQRQPEFTSSFADYYTVRVNDQRILQGRKLQDTHRDLLAGVEKEYGVPARYLLAFWGLETNYGGFYGNTPVLDALATLACEGRRGEYFSRELINALRIVQEGAIDTERMRGSWAGAMGQVQFMPSIFLAHAVDADGDGRRDLWNSLPDALSSAANFLRDLGWHPGERWGREVTLPADFDFRHAGLAETRPLSAWRELGVRLPEGDPLPDEQLQAALLVPSGHQGPAFLVYHNFRVILGWNRSEAYALAVGRLADRIAGAAPLSRAPVPAPRLRRDQVVELQHRLNERGFDAGEPDGILGPGTRAALGRFQHAQKMIADGFPDAQTLRRTGLISDDAAADAPSR